MTLPRRPDPSGHTTGFAIHGCLLDLARWSAEPQRARHTATAARMLTSLSSHYRCRGTPTGSILIHSVGNHPQTSEVDVALVYSDYYFIDAFLRRSGLFLE